MDRQCPAALQRLANAKGGQGGCVKALKSDGRFHSMLHSRDKRTELFSMPLFMKETPFPPVQVAAVKVAGSEVLAYCGSPLTENFDAFFRHARASRTEVEDLAPRAIGESNVNVNVVFRVGVKMVHGPCLDFHRERGRQKPHEVYEVADLANHSAMTLGRVMNPVPARQPSCVHPVKHRQRPNAALKQISAIRGEGREAAIKAHGQDSPRTCISLGYLIQFGFIDA